MRKPFIAGNWKMNLNRNEAVALIAELTPLVREAKCDVVICPPAIDIPVASEAIKNTNIGLGSQNIHWAKSGAYTGEVSADMLKSYDVAYAIIGHSERRTYFGETDETVNKRALFALENDIVPIICVGESLETKEAGKTLSFVEAQVTKALAGMTKEQVAALIIAYEPIWAIGTGKTATAVEADTTIGQIRSCVGKLFDKATAESIRILYGGSMNAKNAEELLSMENIDGGLIGGAALKAVDFSVICKSAK